MSATPPPPLETPLETPVDAPLGVPLENPQPKSSEKKTHGSRLTRDQRRDILMLRELHEKEGNFSYERISSILSRKYSRPITVRAVQYTCNTKRATPEPKTGRPSQISQERVDEIDAWVTANRSGRKPTYRETAEHFGCSEEAVKYALKKKRGRVRKRARKSTDTGHDIINTTPIPSPARDSVAS